MPRGAFVVNRFRVPPAVSKGTPTERDAAEAIAKRAPGLEVDAPARVLHAYADATRLAGLDALHVRKLDETARGRVMAPIGIDIGARTPEETAIAICAEIISRRAHAPVALLRDGSGPIHRGSP